MIRFAPNQYELVDFGLGRKLERFAGVLVDRPCPAAADVQPQSGEWSEAIGRFDAERWSWTADPPADWRVTLPIDGASPPLMLALRPTDAGQVGVFPEQLRNWQRMASVISTAGRPMRILNLFAYTGASTLAAAAAGAEVAHVDAARSAVAWARSNAELSGLALAPIRWIVDDASAFVRRELRRGRVYDGVVLDPPSYGHGPKGQAWRLAEDLAALVADCLRLIQASAMGFIILSCHTTGVTADELAALLGGFGRATAETMWLSTATGRRLAGGVCAGLHAAGSP